MIGRAIVRGAAICGGLIVLLLGIVLAAGWLGFIGASAGGTLQSGRAVTARSDGFSLGMQFQRDTATFRTRGLTVVVAPSEVTVDGRRVAALDAAARQVDVAVEDGRIDVVADGRMVSWRQRLGSAPAAR